MSGLSGNWHVFGQDGNWIASSDGHGNTTVAQVYGFSPEEVRLRAKAISALPDLLKRLLGMIPIRPSVSSLSWLRSMVDACNTCTAAEELGGEDQEAWFMMVQEVQVLLNRAEAAVRKARVGDQRVSG